MDKKRQEKIYELLKRGSKLIETGEELPAEWAREFSPPERREYELVYNGKETEEQILADTMAVPFQEVSTFRQNDVDWHNKLIFGDNLQAMKTLLQMKENGKLTNADGTPGIRLKNTAVNLWNTPSRLMGRVSLSFSTLSAPYKHPYILENVRMSFCAITMV